MITNEMIIGGKHERSKNVLMMAHELARHFPQIFASTSGGPNQTAIATIIMMLPAAPK